MRANRSDSSFIVKVMRNSVLILLLIVFISIVYNFRNKQAPTAVALMSDATASREFKGVFIRDETPVMCTAGGVISYDVADGGKLGNGTVIAEVYPTDEQIVRNREISKLERELSILKKIQNPGTIESAQPSNLSESIEEKYRSMIYSRDTHNYSALEKDMEDLLIQMSTYQIITKQVSGFDQQITDINAKLAELKSLSVTPSETIKSPRSAYFVSYCDGYDSVLKPDKLDSLTIADINSIEDRKSTEGNIVGKLIEGYGWYLAGVIDNSRKEYAIGGSVKIKFDSNADTLDAAVKDIRDEGDPSKSIIILECDQFNYDLVQHRADDLAPVLRGEEGVGVGRHVLGHQAQAPSARRDVHLGDVRRGDLGAPLAQTRQKGSGALLRILVIGIGDGERELLRGGDIVLLEQIPDIGALRVLVDAGDEAEGVGVEIDHRLEHDTALREIVHPEQLHIRHLR